jgi:1-acyl-sn-glycerol-3-phosphate acyltransferase
MDKLPEDNIRLRRSRFLLGVAKSMAWPIIKTTSHKHYDIPEETLYLMKDQYKYKDSAIYYVAPHKSLWETLGIPYTISWHDGDIPFIMMGNNLVKKETGIRERMLHYVLDRIGLVMVERENNPKAAISSMISNIDYILSNNKNVLIFPEGTRSRDGLIKDFRPAGFQGVLDAAKNTAVFIVNINVDYSQLFELEDFMADSKRYTFKFQDSKDWKRKHLGDTYITFSEPMRITPEYDRKDLARISRDICMDMVVIQPVNVLSKAMIQLNPEPNSLITGKSLDAAIEKVINDWAPYEEKFRDFNLKTSPLEIISKANLPIDPNFMKGYSIYSNYTEHYAA